MSANSQIKPTATTRPVPAVKQPRRTQAERRQATQEKLVQGAIRLLKEKRYAGFRTAEVSAVAGLSRGAQTHHFATKDDLVLLALEQVYQETSARSRRQIAIAEPTREGLIKALVDDSAEFFLGDDFLMSLDLVMVGADEAFQVAVRKLAKRYRLAVEDEWRQAFLEAGCSPEDTDKIIWITFAVGRGLGVRQVMSGTSMKFRQVLEQWGEIARGSVSGTVTGTGVDKGAASLRESSPRLVRR